MLKKVCKVLLLSVVVGSLSFTLLSDNTLAGESLKVSRIGGKNRIETAIKIGEKSHKEKADAVILVGYEGQVDALTGTILAKEKNAPILYTKKKELSVDTKSKIDALGVKDVYILGGEGVIAKSVEKSLGSSYNVKRIAGDNRIETAVAILHEVKGELEPVDEMFLAEGYDSYADALSVGPITAKADKPLLLVNNSAGTLKFLWGESFNQLVNSKVKKVTILGGENAISKEIEKELSEKGFIVNRIAGKNRAETSLKIAKEYMSDIDSITLANGYNSADAVSGGAFAYKENSPILLTKVNSIDVDSLNYISENQKDVHILGMFNAISKEVSDEVENVLLNKLTVKEEIKSEKIPFKTVKQTDITLEKGKEKVKQKGVNGEKSVTERVVLKGNKEISRKAVGNPKVTKKAIDEVILVGAKVGLERVTSWEKYIIEGVLNSVNGSSYQKKKLLQGEEGMLPELDILTYQYLTGQINGKKLKEEAFKLRDDHPQYGAPPIKDYFMVIGFKEMEVYKTKETDIKKIFKVDSKLYDRFVYLTISGIDYTNVYVTYDKVAKEYTVKAIATRIDSDPTDRLYYKSNIY